MIISTGGIVGGKNVALARCEATANVSAWLQGAVLSRGLRPACSRAVTQPVLRNSAAAALPLRKTGVRTPAPLWSSLIKDNSVNNTKVAQPAAASGGRSALLNRPRAKQPIGALVVVTKNHNIKNKKNVNKIQLWSSTSVSRNKQVISVFLMIPLTGAWPLCPIRRWTAA